MAEHGNRKGVLAGLLAETGLASSLGVRHGQDGAQGTMPSGRATALQCPTGSRRLKLWELESKSLCPVIGTCLSMDELKKIARRHGFEGQDHGAYRLHVEAVSLAASRNEASEAMHKLLERKYSLVVGEFSRLRSDAAVHALWKECLERGDVAGPLWSVMTHKLASAETRHAIYGDVHMLSHQLGAGQAADLRRFGQLQHEHTVLQAAHIAVKEAEAETAYANRALTRELQDVRSQLRTREATLATLTQRLHAFESGEAMVAMGRRLVTAQTQAERASALEVHVQALERKVGQLTAENRCLARELKETTAERDALERLWETGISPLDTACSGACERCDQRLQGRCVLCVGGRTPLLPQYRQLAERLGVRLIHHDGGREEALARLPELLHASDAVICPTDCVGHLAYYQLKKYCKQTGKPCVLTKNSGVAGFAAALERLAADKADIRTRT